MGQQYQIQATDALQALLGDAALAAKYLVDFADASTDLGAFEPIGDMAKGEIAKFVEQNLGKLHAAINSGGPINLEE